MDNLSIDWKAIRPITGSRSMGFEELCAQLAESEIPKDAQFVRTGSPDAGVECYAILSDGNEWGWQAKYFDSLGDTQWSQLDDSVKTTLEKHPRLVKYYVCVPYDRPDARIKGRKSAKEKWDDHVTKWTGWANSKDMEVEFVYFGSHELLAFLGKPQHYGRLRFWFDVHLFDENWFDARLIESIKTAGARYTPEINIELPLSREFEIFGRTQFYFNLLKTYTKGIRKKSEFLHYPLIKSSGEAIVDQASQLNFKVQGILAQLDHIEYQPVVDLHFNEIIAQAEAAEKTAEILEQLLRQRAEDYRSKKTEKENVNKRPTYDHNPFQDYLYDLGYLSEKLDQLIEEIDHAIKLTQSSLLILKGEAGIGKTHLLCDVANNRIRNGQPTILLMGQRFTTLDEPWTQISQLLDLQGLTLEEFIGALEASAQAANCRVLLIIDAINEGTGRKIWPVHLAAFLSNLIKSPWIGVVLSVRTSFEEIVIPEEIRTKSFSITHIGFADNEYNASRSFFQFYKIEFPSTPLLSPEFRNPLFLKTLCHSLNADGQKRIPRGLQGITKIFNYYLKIINTELARTLGFNPKSPIVEQALSGFAKGLVDYGENWLPISIAEPLINSFLPDHDFEHSLYHGLILEGVLTEDIFHKNHETQDAVFIAFDRFTDHLIAQELISSYVDIKDPQNTNNIQKLLLFLMNEKKFISPGLLEALCIQIPERTGCELITLAPEIMEQWSINKAFKQSIIWREPTAVFNETREILNKLTHNELDLLETIDTLLVVSCIPGHPLNAEYLNNLLCKFTLADRDAWWSTSIHKLWGNQYSVNKLIDWGLSITSSISIEKEVVDLTSTTITWMLSSSNRFLRDKATKALVCLLANRFDSVIELVNKFKDVDDPYILERVYAVVYGIVMRSNDSDSIGRIATLVYEIIFKDGTPPAHILLRDYARGIVERALYLGVKMKIKTKLIRPPYQSSWPHIPSEVEIKSLFPNRFKESREYNKEEWARDRLYHSVMADDFAYYVIGTNSHSNDWLSLRLSEPCWEPPIKPEDYLNALISDFTEEEKAKWDEYSNSHLSLKNELSIAFSAIFDAQPNKDLNIDESIHLENLLKRVDEKRNQKALSLENERQECLYFLRSALSADHLRGLDEYYSLIANERELEKEPRFDLSQIQRYVLWRVFDLGWTTKRFGNFDQYYVNRDGRSASKVERIGKKYQWIAFHEILAYLADNFQYREYFGRDKGDKEYLGPWQNNYRNIDPSCTFASVPGGTTFECHLPGWWDPKYFSDWNNHKSSESWVRDYESIPKIENLLLVTNPNDGKHWINLHAHYCWKEPIPPDKESSDVERKELWYSFHGYLIRTQDIEAYLHWAENVDFWGDWMPDPSSMDDVFLGEHGWAPASLYFQKQYSKDYGGNWIRPDHECPIKVLPCSIKYSCEDGGFDCSIDETFHLSLPIWSLLTDLDLHWTGNGADFVDSKGNLVVFDPSVYSQGPDSILFSKDKLLDFLKQKHLTLMWTIIGSKEAIGPGFGPTEYLSLRINGTIVLNGDSFRGFQKYQFESRSKKSKHNSEMPIAIIRYPKGE